MPCRGSGPLLVFAVDIGRSADEWFTALFGTIALGLALVLLLAIVLFLTVIFGSPKDGGGK
jgi:hypothetical protein